MSTTSSEYHHLYSATPHPLSRSNRMASPDNQSLKKKKKKSSKKAKELSAKELWTKELSAKEYQAKIATDQHTISVLRDENQELMSRLLKLRLAREKEGENIQLLAEKEGLQSRIQELEKKLKNKDFRIEKLESTKLTNGKATSIKKLKQELEVYYNTAEQYKMKLASAEKIISRLQSKQVDLEKENKELKSFLRKLEKRCRSKRKTPE